MKPSRFTEEQIIGILREQEAGAATAEVCRKHGVSSATFCKWKARYGGLEVSDARRLKAIEDERHVGLHLVSTFFAHPVDLGFLDHFAELLIGKLLENDATRGVGVEEIVEMRPRKILSDAP